MRRGINVLGAFSTELKSQCMPLMAADFLASTDSKRRAEQRWRGRMPPYKEIPPPRRGRETDIAFINMQEGTLDVLKKHFERERQLGIEHWRAKKAVRLSSARRFS